LIRHITHAFIIVGILISPSLAADTFIPNLRDQYPAIIWAQGYNKQAISIFQNPAQTAGASSPQLLLNHTSPALDFNQITAAYLFPISVFRIGIGVNVFNSNNIPRNVIGGSGRPETIGSIPFSINQIKLSAALPLSSEVSFGTTLSNFQQTLDTDSLQNFSLDLGFKYQMHPQLVFGIYTQNLLQGELVWTTGTSAGSLERAIIVEGSYYFDQSSISFSTDLNDFLIGSEWFLSPQFSVFGHLNFSPKFADSQLGIGTGLYFDPFSIRYSFYQETVPGLQSTQHIIGIHYNFDSERAYQKIKKNNGIALLFKSNQVPIVETYFKKAVLQNPRFKFQDDDVSTRYVVIYDVDPQKTPTTLDLRVFDRSQNSWYTASSEVQLQDKANLIEVFSTLLTTLEEKDSD